MNVTKTDTVLTALVLLSGYFIMSGHKNTAHHPSGFRDAVNDSSGGAMDSLKSSAGDVKTNIPAQAATAAADNQLLNEYLRLITAQFSWYGESEQKSGLTDAQLAQAVVTGLKQGVYDAVVLGESHGNKREQKAARLIIGEILAGEIPVGAFLQEAVQQTKKSSDPIVRYEESIFIPAPQQLKNSTAAPIGVFEDVDQLIHAHVPVLFMKNQFNPDKDVNAGLQTAGAKLLITYSGSAHTAVCMRDYIINTLKSADMGWGHTYPGRPVIEQTLQNRGKKPVIIAMADESYVFNRIITTQLKEASNNVSYEQWQTNLEALKTAWNMTMGSFQCSSSSIRFVQSDEQPGFYIGIADGERRPLGIEAIQKIAQMPEFLQWLGDKNIRSVDAGLFSTSPCPNDGTCCRGYSVSVRNGEQEFNRSVCVTDLP